MNRISRTRKVIGNILLVLVILLAADAVIVMSSRINAVVLKADYRKILVYELILCAILLLLALDIRFNLFTRRKPKLLKGIGWILRTVTVLLSAVILFFCGRVVAGASSIRQARQIMPSFSDWRWKTEARQMICWQE